MTIELNLWPMMTVEPGDPLPGRAALQALQSGTLALVVLRNRLPGSALVATQQMLARYRTAAAVNRYSNATLTTFGPYLARHLRDPGEYFARAGEADVLFPDPQTDLRQNVRDLLREAFGLRSVSVAAESDGRCYAGGVVRLHADGVCNPLHNDHIARDAAHSGLVLGGLRAQLSCVTCLQECTFGGELRHYKRLWHPADERFKANGLGYDAAVVEGVPCLTFKPQTGDVYIMNPVHYHEIAAVGGAERQTLGFFFGLMTEDANDVVAWS